MFSLNHKILDQILEETIPSFQLTCRSTRNLGFGFIFYGIARSLRPGTTVVVGSKAGFAPICFGLAVKDNEGSGVLEVDCEATHLLRQGTGRVHFVDPSKSLYRGDENHSYGIGTWDEPGAAARIFARFGVDRVITHFKQTSEQYLASSCPAEIDLLYVDGDHSFDGIMNDLLGFHPRLSPHAVVLAHDVHPNLTDSDGYAVLRALPPGLYESAWLPITPGLALLRPLNGEADHSL